jgi:hypothetical protein
LRPVSGRAQVIESVSPPRVLVAEPHDETRLVYCSLFGQAGCDVVDASDGRDALAKALVRVPSIDRARRLADAVLLKPTSPATVPARDVTRSC